MEVIFWCPSEKKTVGSIECKPGEVINNVGSLMFITRSPGLSAGPRPPLVF